MNDPTTSTPTATEPRRTIGDTLRGLIGASLDECDQALFAIENALPRERDNDRVKACEGNLRVAQLMLQTALDNIGEAPK